MKQTVLDVLMHLFDSEFDAGTGRAASDESARSDLLEAGFEEQNVAQALEWLG